MEGPRLIPIRLTRIIGTGLVHLDGFMVEEPGSSNQTPEAEPIDMDPQIQSEDKFEEDVQGQ